MDIETAMRRLTKEHGASSLKAFASGNDAVQRLIKLENRERDDLMEAAQALAEGKSSPAQVETRAHYPILAIPVSKRVTPPNEASFGWVRADRGQGGLFFRTMSRTDFHSSYLTEQIDILLKRYETEAIVGLSNVPIPLVYATQQSFPDKVAENFSPVFTDDLAYCDEFGKDEFPLCLSTGLERDYAWNFFQHYSGTSMEHLQRFVIFTNYKMHMSEFRKYAKSQMQIAKKKRRYCEFIMPEAVLEAENGNGDDSKDPQMPAYHLKRPDGNGVSIIQIGVGPSNAWNMARKVCTRRPHAVIMLGHCAGLQANQRPGNFIMATSYARFGGVADRYLDMRAAISPTAELQTELTDKLQMHLGFESRDELYHMMQGGAVASTGDREWEKDREYIALINKSLSCAVDMESETIGAATSLGATPHASLLCISDMPLHGRQKIAGSAQSFYRKSKKVHLMTAIKTCEAFQDDPKKRDGLHGRKLRRPLDHPPFR